MKVKKAKAKKKSKPKINDSHTRIIHDMTGGNKLAYKYSMDDGRWSGPVGTGGLSG